jgi:hypothetical protein
MTWLTLTLLILAGVGFVALLAQRVGLSLALRRPARCTNWRRASRTPRSPACRTR